MNLDRFIRERSPLWAELDDLVRKAHGRVDRLGPAGIGRLGELYRAAAADVATARRRFPGDPAFTRLERLLNDAYGLTYGSHRREGSLREFVSHRFWQLVREDRSALGLSATLLLAPALAAFLFALANPAAAAHLAPSSVSAVVQPRAHGAALGIAASQSAGLSAQIFTNNIGVAFLALAGGMTAGVLTALSLLYNGMTIGVVFGLAFGAGQSGVAIQLLVPHGVLELSCIVVAGSTGFRLARAIVSPGRARRADALRAVAPRAGETVLGVAAWLVLAGLIEGFVTPSGIGVVPALVVGFGVGGAFWSLVIWRGSGRAGGAPAIVAKPVTVPAAGLPKQGFRRARASST
jgi:uncharacterized membrane protein SpoIIM required for sporulation